MIAVGAEVQPRVAEPDQAGGEQHADGLIEIVGGHDAALFARSRCAAACRRRAARRRVRWPSPGRRRRRWQSAKEWRTADQREGEESHEGGAQGHEAEFHLVAGEAPGQHVARADADGEEGPEQARRRYRRRAARLLPKYCRSVLSSTPANQK